MAEFYTLEEAARVLGMSPDELRGKAEAREVRAFLDGGTWRFRTPDLDELARRRGMGSDPELSLSDLDLIDQAGSGSGSGSDFELPAGPSGSGGEVDVLMDDINLPPSPMTNSSSTIIGMEPAGKRPGDSDVRIVPPLGKGASDSDVQLGLKPEAPRPTAPRPTPKSPLDSDVVLRPMAPGDSDVRLSGSGLGLGRGDSSIRQGDAPGSRPKGPSGSNIPKAPRPGSSSEIKAAAPGPSADPDGDSDFELSALDGSDEFDASPPPARKGPGDSDVTGFGPSASGINLARPSDSGINLQAASGFNLGGGSSDSVELAALDDIDLSPLSSSALRPAGGSRDEDDSELSATALPVQAQRDLFEDTDFEVDARDGDDSHTVQIDSASDFDLDDGGDSASQVFAVDEEDVDLNAATALGPAALDDIDDSSGEMDTPAAAASDVAPGAWDVAGETEPAPAGRGVVAPVLASSEARHEWGGIWVGFLMVATVFLLVLSFVAMDLLHNMYEYRGETPIGSGVVKSLSGLIGS